MSSTEEEEAIELEVRRTLTAYKLALINTNYRNWNHRLMLWLGDDEAVKFEAALVELEAIARKVANTSEAHKRYVRIVSSQQPSFVRDRDQFLALLA